MNWFKKIWRSFKAVQAAEQHPIDTSKFYIEYYPYSGRYYPKYKGKHLVHTFNKKGEVGLTGVSWPTSSYRTQQAAEDIITLYIEQKDKGLVIIIPYDPLGKGPEKTA